MQVKQLTGMQRHRVDQFWQEVQALLHLQLQVYQRIQLIMQKPETRLQVAFLVQEQLLLQQLITLREILVMHYISMAQMIM